MTGVVGPVVPELMTVGVTGELVGRTTVTIGVMAAVVGVVVDAAGAGAVVKKYTVQSL